MTYIIMDNKKNPSTSTSMDKIVTKGIDISHNKNQKNDEKYIVIDGIEYCKGRQCDNCRACIYDDEQEIQRINDMGDDDQSD